MGVHTNQHKVSHMHTVPQPLWIVVNYLAGVHNRLKILIFNDKHLYTHKPFPVRYVATYIYLVGLTGGVCIHSNGGREVNSARWLTAS